VVGQVFDLIPYVTKDQVKDLTYSYERLLVARSVVLPWENPQRCARLNFA
jgi:hypothetical protein